MSLWKFQLLRRETGSDVHLRLSGVSGLARRRLSSGGGYVACDDDVKKKICFARSLEIFKTVLGQSKLEFPL